MRNTTHALCAIAVLAACRADGIPGSQAAGGGTCGADALQHLVGVPLAQADLGTPPGPVRIIPPGTAVTMDHRPERLNVETDEEGRIVRVRCG